MYQQFIAKTLEVMKQANELYNLNIDLTVRVDLRGSKIAGQAQRKLGRYIVRLNPLFCQQFPEDTLKETIPHEVAHIVAFALKQDDGHGPKWKRIAQSLGCSGNRCHDHTIIDPRKETYMVVFPCGKKIEIGKIRYNRIMRGRKTYNSAYGPITKNSNFEIVKPKVSANAPMSVETAKKEAKKATETAKKIVAGVKKPANVSMQYFLDCNGDFKQFSDCLYGKTAQYVKDQFKRCVAHS